MFTVTPKGKNKERPLGLSTILPYLGIILISGLLVIGIETKQHVEGYRWLAMLDITIYTIALAVVVYQHVKENIGNPRSMLSAVPGILGSATGILVISITLRTALQRIPPLLAANVEPTPTFVYVGLRSQLEPTPMPTQQPNPIIREIPTLIPVFPTPTPLPIVSLPTGRMLTGMYNPAGTFSDTHFDLYAAFTDWNNPEETGSALASAQKVGEFPLVTLQPLHRPGLDPDRLLQDISAGKYDDLIIANAREIGRYAPQKVIIRWGHEMDLCSTYEWSTCVAGNYILAYRHVVDLVRQQGVTNIVWMWSPAGNSNAEEFWPGENYVDIIGVTVLSSEDWDRLYQSPKPWPTPMDTWMYQRYRLADEYKKPMMIAELGVSYSNPAIDRTSWLAEGFRLVNQAKYPRLSGWVFYNDITKTQLHVSLLPDFRVSHAELLNALAQSGGY